MWLYAGAGIVGSSLPQKEWDETTLKFRPMLNALGLATFFLWVADYAVTQTFPLLDAKGSWLVQQFNHAFPFYVYAAFCLVLMLVLWRLVPETKGRTLEEIEAILVDRPRRGFETKEA